MRKTLAVVVAVLLLASARPAAQQTPVFTPFGAFPVLEAYLEAMRQQAAIPGMSAAVVHDGVVLWERGFGFQNVASRIRATPDTPFLVGDLTSNLASVLLLQCAEDRHIDLDRHVRLYGAQNSEPEATTRQLLSHSASTDSAPEAFAYSPERFGQLTAVVEHCVPQPYRKTVAHRLLNRLAMKDSVPGTDFMKPELELQEAEFFEPERERYRRILDRLATPYKVDSRGRAERVEVPLGGLDASAGLVSTVRDLARLDGALDQRVLLRDDTIEAAWQPVIGRKGLPVPMGLGWFVQSYRGERVVWHFGYVPNAYSSLIVKLPARNLTFILLANSDGLSAPFQLHAGDVTKSLFASLFLRLAQP